MAKCLLGVAAALGLFATATAALAGQLPEGLVISGLNDGRWQVYRADTEGKLQAVGIEDHARSVAPGPNGERLAYIAVDGSLKVYELGSGATRTRLAAPDDDVITDPVYTADGQLLFVVLVDGNSRDTYIGRVSQDGKLAEYHDQSSSQFSPAAASDGRLAYVGTICRSGCGGLIQTIWSYQPASGRANQLTRLNAVSRQPYAGPDGGVYFSSDAAGSYDIWHVPAAGARAKPVTETSARDAAPVAAGDGRLYFLRHGDQGARLMRLRRDGEPAEPVDQAGAFDNLKDLSLHPCTYSDCS